LKPILILGLLGGSVFAAEDSARQLVSLTDSDPKGTACGDYLRVDGDKLIFHFQGEEKAAAEPIGSISKIEIDDTVKVPSIRSKPYAAGVFLTVVVSAVQKEKATCLPASVYVEHK
jgi:hypothetical protein